MFALGIYVGYVETSSIRYHEDGKTTFLLTTGGKRQYRCCIKQNTLSNEWFIKYFDRTHKMFKGNLVICQGNIINYTVQKGNIIYKAMTLDVDFIEFLDFTSKGPNAIDSGKFYDRKILDWERYFSNDKFIK
ncbi:MAG TPA: hypothetical protein PKV66_05550 [Candidatus Pelethenecus sp.]|nr:hypothetical protein [Candidatus Pelethenecus sp.]